MGKCVTCIKPSSKSHGILPYLLKLFFFPSAVLQAIFIFKKKNTIQQSDDYTGFKQSSRLAKCVLWTCKRWNDSAAQTSICDCTRSLSLPFDLLCLFQSVFWNKHLDKPTKHGGLFSNLPDCPPARAPCFFLISCHVRNYFETWKGYVSSVDSELLMIPDGFV